MHDLQHDLAYVQDRQIISIFMGGGTPSLFSPESMNQLLTRIRQHLSFVSDCEITMEMNPGAVEHGNLTAYRTAGINRLSIGIQSFDPAQLKKLGRIHSDTEAKDIVGKAQQAGFDNINIDLMYALPQQDVAGAIADLQQAIDLKPQHLSWYHLTMEPNTEFYRQPPVLPDEDTSMAIESAGKEFLRQAGFQQYEISAYSTDPKRRARHNLNYWEFGDYLGIGAGAHSKITNLNTGVITRYWKQRTPRNYLVKENALAGERILTSADKVTEFMFNALRLNAGFPRELFMERTDLTLEDENSQGPTLALQQAQQRGLLEIDDTSIRPTPLGLQFQNELIHLFMEK